MSELEIESKRYSDEVVDSAEGITVSMLKQYAKDDFIAGAEWQKEHSKAREMLEMLEKVKGAVLIAEDMRLYREIENLIKESTTI